MPLVNGVSSHENEPTVNRLFPDIDPDDPANETTQIESYCVNCGGNGTTRLLLTRIPFYKEVVLMSFDCEKCGYCNNEINSAGKIEEKGVRVTLKVNTASDLNRQVIKSDYTSVKFPDLDFEIPSQSQKGEVTTIEGIIDRAIEGLSQDQDLRMEQDPVNAEKIQEFLEKLRGLKALSKPFEMILEDISGNSWIENPKAPRADPHCKTSHFTRSKEEDHALGIYSREEIQSEEETEGESEATNIDESSILPPLGSGPPLDLEQEVLTFLTNCPLCGASTTTNMKLTKIPYFKEVVIMATSCESCGHRTNEIKSGAGIESEGVTIEVDISKRDDFSRDLLKSETCSVLIPELEFEAGPFLVGGGKFTTVEGLLTTLKAELEKSVLMRDTLQAEVAAALSNIAKRLEKVLACEDSITLVLDDPAGNSYIQSLTPPEADPALRIKHYKRSYDQDEELGLNDMKTENY